MPTGSAEPRRKPAVTGARHSRDVRARRSGLVLGAGILSTATLLGMVMSVVAPSPGAMADAAGPPARAAGPVRAEGAGPAPSPTASGQARRGAPQPVTLAFGGDVHFEGLIRGRLDDDPASVLAGVAPLLRSADVAVVNLETAITSGGTRSAGKEFTFRAPPAALSALRAAGVDVASLANNHGMDYGREGLEDSLAASAAAGFPLVGAGRDAAQAYRPFMAAVRGQRIAVLAATQVLDDDLRRAWTATDTQPGLASAKEVDRLLAAVRAARGQADTVVVYLHWGVEGETCPSEVQTELARQLRDAGADVIVGGHAHRLQGAGRLGSAFVAYGLGNFAFSTGAGPGADTGVLTVTVTGRRVEGYRWAPAQLVGQLPRLLEGTAARRASASWDRLRPCTGLDP